MLNENRTVKNGTTASLTTSASRILLPDNNRGRAILQNLDASIVIWVGDKNVTTSNLGVKLAAGETYEFLGRGELWAVAASATPSLGIQTETTTSNAVKSYVYTTVTVTDALTKLQSKNDRRVRTTIQNLSSSTIEVGNASIGLGSGGISLAAGKKISFTAIGALYAIGAGTAEVQSLSVDATGGTFTLTQDGQTTSALAFGANAGAIQTALRALSTIGTGNVTVSGTGPFTITYAGTLANVNMSALVPNSTSLTGNTHTAAISTSTQGASGTYVVGVTAELM